MAGKVEAWMPLWIGDILGETMGLNRDQFGGYMWLLFAYWRNKGPLPDDDEALAATVKASTEEWRERLRPKLAPFFMLQESSWHHERMDIELAKATKNKTAATNKAKKAADTRWGNAPSIPQAAPGACFSESPSPSPSPSVGGEPPTTPSADAPGTERDDAAPDGDSEAKRLMATRGTPAAGKIEMADYNLPLPEWLAPHAEAWAAFQDIRRKKNAKAPYTRAAQKGILRELERFHGEGQDLSVVLMASVNAGWTSVFPQRAPHRAAGAACGSRFAGAGAAVFGSSPSRQSEVLDVEPR